MALGIMSDMICRWKIRIIVEINHFHCFEHGINYAQAKVK